MHQVLNTLDPQAAGDGLMTYRADINRFAPRSAIMKGSPAFQSLANIFSKTASFTVFIDGLEKTREMAQKIFDKINQLPLDRLDEAYIQMLQAKLTRINSLIDTKSNLCIKQLIFNYSKKKKEKEKTDQITGKAEQTFTMLRASLRRVTEKSPITAIDDDIKSLASKLKPETTATSSAASAAIISDDIAHQEPVEQQHAWRQNPSWAMPPNIKRT